MELAHPLRVSGGQVVVHRDHVDPVALEGVQVDRQRRDQGLALTGLHLGDPPEVEGHAAHQLGVEVPLAEYPPGRLPHQGEGLDQQVLQALPVVEALTELTGERGQLVVGSGLHLRLEGVDQGHQLGQTTDLLPLAGAEDFREHAHGPLTLPSDVSVTGRRDRSAAGPRPRGTAPNRFRRYGPALAGWRPSWPDGAGDGSGPPVAPWSSRAGARASPPPGPRRQRHRSGRPGPDGAPVAHDDHLAPFAVGDPRIVLLGEVDLGPLQARTEMAEPAHLLLGQSPHFVGHDPSAVGNDNVHLLASMVGVFGCYRWCRPVLLIGRRD